MMKVLQAKFKVSLLVPILQTSSVLITTSLLGRLGVHTISFPAAFVLSTTAALTSALAHNFLKNSLPAIPMGMMIGVGIHKLLFPSIPLSSIISPQGALILTSVLVSVKLVANYTLYTIKHRKKDFTSPTAC